MRRALRTVRCRCELQTFEAANPMAVAIVANEPTTAIDNNNRAHNSIQLANEQVNAAKPVANALTVGIAAAIVDDDKLRHDKQSFRCSTDQEAEIASWRTYYCRKDRLVVDSVESPLEHVISRYEGATSRFCDVAGLVESETRLCYQGEFDDKQRRDGLGQLIWPDGTRYEGSFRHNRIAGRGVFHWSDGSVYVGHVSNAYRHGRGKFVEAATGDCYGGQWQWGRRHGRGRQLYGGSLSDFYVGEWSSDLPHGRGLRRYRSGNVYDGDWQYGEPSGSGLMLWSDRRELYKGEFKHGECNGVGVHVWLTHVSKVHYHRIIHDTST